MAEGRLPVKPALADIGGILFREIFQHGIGRHAFHPLNESDWVSGGNNNQRKFRVIGVVDGDEAHAYSVPKLSHHEIANTKLASKPIMAG